MNRISSASAALDSVSEAGFVDDGRTINIPKMTLQQFKMHMILSLGAR